jgi:prepilin-type N-terminal cleavage/methylation domain-containing protein/prepilin-type processing-associated H-X9-DG protein
MRGFTLIELLVVIAIIAILAAILFPVFAQAKLAGKKAACLSNTKQWSLAFALYVGDTDGQYPLFGYTGAIEGPLNVPYIDSQTGQTVLRGAGLGSIWFNAVAPYAKNRDIMISPGDGTPQYSRFPYILSNGTILQRPKLSYPINDMLGGGGFLNGVNFWNPATESDFAAPADTIIVVAAKTNGNRNGTGNGTSGGFGERFGWLISGYEVNGLPWDNNNNRLDAIGAPFFNGGTNFAFGDGHAKFFRTTNGQTSLLNGTLPWQRHVVPNQDCASWKVPSADWAGPGVSPGLCSWR